ncbi:hypothetical protein DL765_006501 [Monosporascus sp. GIB2]|nr:hypothetical protein DL765_006501 [Monosporascus sp. GIB2]
MLGGGASTVTLIYIDLGPFHFHASDKMKFLAGLLGFAGLILSVQPLLVADPKPAVPRGDTAPLPDASPLKPRAGTFKGPPGRPKCSLKGLFKSCQNDGSSASVRRHHEPETHFNGSMAEIVFKREMTMPASLSKSAMDDFMVEETGKYPSACYENQVGRDVNTGVFVQWRPRSQELQGLSLKYMAGCTALVLVSRKGAFMGHYWENIGFNLDEEEHGDLYPDQETAFRRSILDLLHQGSRDHQSLDVLARQNSLADDHLQAFLMIPDTGNAAEGLGPPDPYREYWNRMKAEINRIFPILAEPNRWFEYQYRPVQNEDKLYELDDNQEEIADADHIIEDPLETEARGRALVKYDNNHHGKNKVMLWMEHGVIYNDEWARR